MEAVKTRLGLTGNQLKLLALVLMTIDHIGVTLVPVGTALYFALRCIGRLAMPIFAWMIAEGCRYTRHRARYLLLISGVGLLCQVVYLVFMQSLTQCIFITFSLSIILIYLLDYAKAKNSFFRLALLGAVFAAVCYVCVFLPGDLPGKDFSIDYSIYGVLLPVLIYMGRTRQEKLLAAAAILVMLAIGYGWVQWFGLLSLPLLALYNGQKGKAKLKYLFYIYYPIHLVVLHGIATFLLRR